MVKEQAPSQAPRKMAPVSGDREPEGHMIAPAGGHIPAAVRPASVARPGVMCACRSGRSFA